MDKFVFISRFFLLDVRCNWRFQCLLSIALFVWIKIQNVPRAVNICLALCADFLWFWGIQIYNRMLKIMCLNNFISNDQRWRYALLQLRFLKPYALNLEDSIQLRYWSEIERINVWQNEDAHGFKALRRIMVNWWRNFSCISYWYLQQCIVILQLWIIWW